jgi:hypothetical protein
MTTGVISHYGLSSQGQQNSSNSAVSTFSPSLPRGSWRKSRKGSFPWSLHILLIAITTVISATYYQMHAIAVSPALLWEDPGEQQTKDQDQHHTWQEARGRSGFEEGSRSRSVHEAGECKKLPSPQSQRYAIIQFDSRKNENGTYWHASSKYNAAYCQRHGHVYKYYTLPSAKNKTCMSFDGTVNLAHPWCKVKTMLRAQDDFPDVDYFLYLDTDAIVSFQFADLPLDALVANLTQKLNWNVLEKPVVFNQDGACWWCKKVLKNTTYTKACLNTGTVAWYRSDRAKQVLQKWWESAMDSYSDKSEGKNPLGIKFRTQWPWEQERAMALYHNLHDQNGDNVSSYIQVASQPERFHMVRHPDWCLSHLQKANCFISHHCINNKDKRLMMKVANDHALALSNTTALTIDVL